MFVPLVAKIILNGNLIPIQDRLFSNHRRFPLILTGDKVGYWDTWLFIGNYRSGIDLKNSGAVFVSEIRGSYSGVVGLPRLETAEVLEQRGFGPLLDE